ncbi:hypothetical protein H4R34_001607 [Dimargaris verticillata]|uniref:CBS domain-containing protein n=1 Tax=Dimargaris verticillata TaxID=2761393 RepID=A0A9W8B3B4_9FUNG|nr:hypothetical protein H4R34_001607 [Dimargaris verticillata]
MTEASTHKFPQITDIVGPTPTVQLSIPNDYKLDPTIELVAKLEYLNPFGSLSDRLARHIVSHLSRHAAPVDATTPAPATLVVPSSGNLAISLASMVGPLGYKILAVIPERTSKDRIGMLKALDVEIVRTLDNVLPSAPESCVSVARQLAQQTPGAHLVDVFSNQLLSTVPPPRHNSGEGGLRAEDAYTAMAEEIMVQCASRLDVLFIGVESGSSITGLSRALKQRLPDLTVVGVEPAHSYISEGVESATPSTSDSAPERLPRSPLITHTWKIEDLGQHDVPRGLDPTCVDFWCQVTDQVAFSMTRRLLRTGFLAGVSSGAVTAAAHTYARAYMKPGQRGLVVMNDTARNYTSTLLSDEWLLNHDLIDDSLSRTLYYNLINKYRGASVEDLQLPTAVAIAPTDTIAHALEVMRERDYSQLPVITAHRQLAGYVTLATLQSLVDHQRAEYTQTIDSVMYHFRPLPKSYGPGSATSRQDAEMSMPGNRPRLGSIRPRYQLITPSTPLNELAKFFEQHSVAFVTDRSRKFCLGVVTKFDLMKFISRRSGLTGSFYGP